MHAKSIIITTAKIVWTFLFYGSDANENRAHVHIGKKGTENFAKIWLEPEVTVAKQGDLTEAQLKQLVKIATENREALLKQWHVFKEGKSVKIIKINK